jgi:hypothetical protein
MRAVATVDPSSVELEWTQCVARFGPCPPAARRHRSRDQAWCLAPGAGADSAELIGHPDQHA